MALNSKLKCFRAFVAFFYNKMGTSIFANLFVFEVMPTYYHNYSHILMGCVATEQDIMTTFTVRNPLLLCPLAQDGGTRSRQKCLHRDFSATVLLWVIMLGEAIFDIKHDF